MVLLQVLLDLVVLQQKSPAVWVCSQPGKLLGCPRSSLTSVLDHENILKGPPHQVIKADEIVQVGGHGATTRPNDDSLPRVESQEDDWVSTGIEAAN